MSGTALAIALLSVLLNAAAQLFLKAGTNIVGTVSFGGADTLQTLLQIARVPWFWAGFACYGISLFTWIATLSRLPVSVALGIFYVLASVLRMRQQCVLLLSGMPMLIARWVCIRWI